MSTTYITTSIPNRIEELKWSDWHTKATLIISAGYILSGYESTIIYTLLNIIGKSQALDSISISCIKAMWMLGLLAGGFASEYASSIYKRRNIYLYSSLALAFFSVGSGLSMSFVSLLVYQFFIGIFIGGEWVIMVSYIAETIPQRHRASVNTFLLVSWLFGVLLANLVELPLLMFLEDSLSWKIALGSASVFGIPIFIARRSLCESPEWLLRQGRVVEAESSMADIEKLSEQPYKENASLRASSFEVPILRDYFEQFHDLFVANRRTVLLEMIFNATTSFAGVGINSYISTVLMPALNFSRKETVMFFLWGNLGAFLLVSMTCFLVSPTNRRISMPISYGLSILGSVVLVVACNFDSRIFIQLSYCAFVIFHSLVWTMMVSGWTEIFTFSTRAPGLICIIGAGGAFGMFAPPLLISITNLSISMSVVVAALVLGFAASIVLYIHSRPPNDPVNTPEVTQV